MRAVLLSVVLLFSHYYTLIGGDGVNMQEQDVARKWQNSFKEGFSWQDLFATETYSPVFDKLNPRTWFNSKTRITIDEQLQSLYNVIKCLMEADVKNACDKIFANTTALFKNVHKQKSSNPQNIPLVNATVAASNKTKTD